MRVFVEAVGVLAPGLQDWEGTKSVLVGEQRFSAAPLAPAAPASLPPAERRRSSPTVRLAIAAAEQALRPRRRRTKWRWCSSHEAAGHTHQLARSGGPAAKFAHAFTTSVHNAPAEYSIAECEARGEQRMAGANGFAAGAERRGEALATKAVLYVFYADHAGAIVRSSR